MKNYQTCIEELKDLLRTMDLPDHRKQPRNNDCLRWLARSLKARNSEHANYARACELLAQLKHPVAA